MSGIADTEFELLDNEHALAKLTDGAIAELTEAATRSTFYQAGLTAEQVAANQRIVAISERTCTAAAGAGHQHLVAGFRRGEFAGFMVATRHGPDDLELDWLMVHPDHHGSDVAAHLMQAGMAWFGADRPIWLTVIRHNERAIGFYRKFGFEIDPEAQTAHAVPHWIMRRAPRGSSRDCLRSA